MAHIHPSISSFHIHPSIHPPTHQPDAERERALLLPFEIAAATSLPIPSWLSPSVSHSAARACTCEIRPGSSRDPHAPLLPPVRRDPARTASSDQALGFGRIRSSKGRGIRRVWGAAGGDAAQDGGVPPRAGLRAAGTAAGPLHLLPSWLHFFVSYICYHEGCSHEEKPLLQDSLLPSSKTLTWVSYTPPSAPCRSDLKWASIAIVMATT